MCLHISTCDLIYLHICSYIFMYLHISLHIFISDMFSSSLSLSLSRSRFSLSCLLSLSLSRFSFFSLSFSFFSLSSLFLLPFFFLSLFLFFCLLGGAFSSTTTLSLWRLLQSHGKLADDRSRLEKAFLDGSKKTIFLRELEANFDGTWKGKSSRSMKIFLTNLCRVIFLLRLPSSSSGSSIKSLSVALRRFNFEPSKRFIFFCERVLHKAEGHMDCCRKFATSSHGPPYFQKMILATCQEAVNFSNDMSRGKRRSQASLSASGLKAIFGRPRFGLGRYCRWPSGLRLTASRGSTPP